VDRPDPEPKFATDDEAFFFGRQPVKVVSRLGYDSRVSDHMYRVEQMVEPVYKFNAYEGDLHLRKKDTAK